jgi:hypothetical protein
MQLYFLGFILLCFFDLVDFPVFLLSKIWYSREDLGEGGGRKQGENMSLPWVTLQDLQEEDINLLSLCTFLFLVSYSSASSMGRSRRREAKVICKKLVYGGRR